jgi:hypothetical protein
VDRRLVSGFCGLVTVALIAGWQPLNADSPRAVERTVERLAASGPNPAPPIASDEEHADAIAPVLTPRTRLLYHDDSRPTTHPLEARYVVSEGRIFALDGVSRHNLDKPMLRIRPVDAGQHVEFVVRSALKPYGPATEDGVLELVFPAPTIFRPSVEVHGAWVADRPVDATVLPRVDAGTVTVRVPVRATDLRTAAGTLRSVPVVLEGTLDLRRYDRVDPDKLLDPEPQPPGDPLAEFASFAIGREFRDDRDRETIVRAARNATAEAPDGYHQIVAINSFVSSAIRYLESPLRRQPGQILQEGVGDCDDYSGLMVALLRALAIPCRPTRGFLYDFGELAPHTWVESALFKADGGIHWFICDPTLAQAAADEEEREAAVQLRSRAHLYPAQPLVVPSSGLPVHHVTDILLNVGGPDSEDRRTPASLETYVLQVSQGVADRFTRLAGALSSSNLRLQRELPLSAGSSYVIGERVISEGRSFIRTVLESDERVAVELAAAGVDVDLGDDSEQTVIDALRASYHHLDWLLFRGLPAHHCLELAYSRDPHSDRLQRVRLSFNRYLVQCHLRPILRRMHRQELWTDEEAALVETLHRTSGGTNLYYLQELARRRAADSTLAP